VTANTILSDINEIWTGYVINGNKWFDAVAQVQYNQRIKQATKEEVEDAKGKAEVMAKEFITWAKTKKYSGIVSGVYWTARKGSMTSVVGVDIDQNKNPTDILVKFTFGPANGFLGLSAKATKGSGDIGFKNPGIGTVDKSLGLDLAALNNKLEDEVVKELNLAKQKTVRKSEIRQKPAIKKITEQKGSEIMSKLRDALLTKLKTMQVKALKDYIISDWMDAGELYPPYVKVTGKGSKPPYTADTTDPLNNTKLSKLITATTITLTKEGNESIGVAVNGSHIMKIRFKYESEKVASSMKLSGDPWT
jgi:hypothetical protein